MALLTLTHLGNHLRLQVILDMRPYWSIDHTEKRGADEIIAFGTSIITPLAVIPKVITLFVGLFLSCCGSIPVSTYELLTVGCNQSFFVFFHEKQFYLL